MSAFQNNLTEDSSIMYHRHCHCDRKNMYHRCLFFQIRQPL